MSIRRVVPDDYITLIDLNYECYPEDKPDPTLSPRLLKVVKNNPCWVYEDSGIKACLLSEISENQPYIWSVATLTSHRGRGIATKLIKEFEKHYASEGHTKAWLHVRVNNPAQKIYFDAGYRVASFERNLYITEDGLTMRHSGI